MRLSVYLHGIRYYFCLIKNHPERYRALELLGINVTKEPFYSDPNQFYYAGNFPKEMLSSVIDVLKMIDVKVEVVNNDSK